MLKQRITPFLWFNTEAEEAAKFYTSIFKDSQIIHVSRYGEGGPMPKGSAMVVNFQIEGQEFSALNGGPVYSFTPAISFYVHCTTQEEIDYYWDNLLEGGGKPEMCGWLRDKYGLSWQIVPEILGELLTSKDGDKSKRVMNAMLKMIKLDISGLQNA